jgi:hypothetical protein
MNVARQAIELGDQECGLLPPAGLEGGPQLRPASQGIASLTCLDLRELGQELSATAVQVVEHRPAHRGRAHCGPAVRCSAPVK